MSKLIKEKQLKELEEDNKVHDSKPPETILKELVEAYAKDKTIKTPVPSIEEFEQGKSHIKTQKFQKDAIKEDGDKKTSGAKAEEKKHWQMTRGEYESKFGAPRSNTTLTGGFSQHKSAVETALNRGLPVPVEVLKDYPNLITKDHPKKDAIKKDAIKEDGDKKTSGAKFGDKRDHPKKDIHVDGKYAGTTTWSKTNKEAKAKFLERSPGNEGKKITVVNQEQKPKITKSWIGKAGEMPSGASKPKMPKPPTPPMMPNKKPVAQQQAQASASGKQMVPKVPKMQKQPGSNMALKTELEKAVVLSSGFDGNQRGDVLDRDPTVSLSAPRGKGQLHIARDSDVTDSGVTDSGVTDSGVKDSNDEDSNDDWEKKRWDLRSKRVDASEKLYQARNNFSDPLSLSQYRDHVSGKQYHEITAPEGGKHEQNLKDLHAAHEEYREHSSNYVKHMKERHPNYGVVKKSEVFSDLYKPELNKSKRVKTLLDIHKLNKNLRKTTAELGKPRIKNQFIVNEEELSSKCSGCNKPQFVLVKNEHKFTPCICFISENQGKEPFVKLLKVEDKINLYFNAKADPESVKSFLLTLKLGLLAKKLSK